MGEWERGREGERGEVRREGERGGSKEREGGRVRKSERSFINYAMLQHFECLLLPQTVSSSCKPVVLLLTVRTAAEAHLVPNLCWLLLRLSINPTTQNKP